MRHPARGSKVRVRWGLLWQKVVSSRRRDADSSKGSNKDSSSKALHNN